MKIKIIKLKNGKIKNQYVAADGLVFNNKDNCQCYENKWMPKSRNK